MELRWCSENGMPHSQLLQWAPEDRAKLTAFLLEEGERCNMCGTYGWEWAEDRKAYEPQESVCMGCFLRETFADGEKRQPGTRLTLVPRAEAERLRAERAAAVSAARAKEAERQWQQRTSKSSTPPMSPAIPEALAKPSPSPSSTGRQQRDFRGS